ncbi:hypothetical protein PENTCL1PPCAC_21425, partial [Pristionchus entomophagus]
LGGCSQDVQPNDVLSDLAHDNIEMYGQAFLPHSRLKRSDQTYVENGYNDTIYVMVDGDGEHVSNVATTSSELEGSNPETTIYYEANKIRFTAIDSGSYLFFQPKNTGILYITIFAVENGRNMTIADAFPMNAGRSVMVDKEGFLRNKDDVPDRVDEQGT